MAVDRAKDESEPGSLCQGDTQEALLSAQKEVGCSCGRRRGKEELNRKGL